MATNSANARGGVREVTRRSVASQFFHNDDVDTLVASGEYSGEDSTSEKVSDRIWHNFPGLISGYMHR